MRGHPGPLVFVVFLFLPHAFLYAQLDVPLSLEQPDIAFQESRPLAPYPVYSDMKPAGNICASCQEEPNPLSTGFKHQAYFQEELGREIRAIYAMDAIAAYLSIRDLVAQRSNAPRTTQDINQEALEAVHVRVVVHEQQVVRDMWAKALGFDVWYPYFQVKKVEAMVKRRMSFRIFRCKCRPRFEKDQLIYTCRRGF